VGRAVLRRLEDAENYIRELEVTGWRRKANNKEDLTSVVK
jgi:hypothetical protein